MDVPANNSYNIYKRVAKIISSETGIVGHHNLTRRRTNDWPTDRPTEYDWYLDAFLDPYLWGLVGGGQSKSVLIVGI